MKINELVQVRKIINKYASQLVDVKLAYKFMKFMRATEADEKFYGEHADAIIMKYAKRKDDGSIEQTDNNMIPIQEEHVADLNNEMTELNDTDADKPDILFKLDELEGLKISAADMMFIADFIEE